MSGGTNWQPSVILGCLKNEKYVGDAILRETVTANNITFKRKTNEGEAPMYYIKDNHPSIIDKEMWEAVQLEMERRRNFALKYGIQKLEYATTDNPFAGRVIGGSCGRVLGRKVWNSPVKNLEE